MSGSLPGLAGRRACGPIIASELAQLFTILGGCPGPAAAAWAGCERRRQRQLLASAASWMRRRKRREMRRVPSLRLW